MHFFSILSFFKTNFFSVLLAIIPLSFIAGNMIININVILIIACTYIFYWKEILKFKTCLLDKLIISFFVIILFTGFYNYYFYSLENIIRQFGFPFKSILFLKYLILYFALRFLIENKKINLKLFFYVSSFSSLFVSFDIFYQYYFGADIFGFETIGQGRKLGGPFGNELIAGGFIQKFSLFTFFLFPIFLSDNLKKFSKFLIPVLASIFILGIIFSGNRMPLLLYVFMISLIIIFLKETRKFLIPFVLFSTIILFIAIKFNSQIKYNFLNLYKESSEMVSVVFNKNERTTHKSAYISEFKTFYETWKLNKYIGGGIKNFRFYCHHRSNIDRSSGFICNMHPHNYYFEILTETGILGFLIISIIFLLVLYDNFIKNRGLYFSKKKNFIIIPFIFLFFIEIFPLKSTGSFFTTGNSTYLFLIMGILISLSRICALEKSN